jgi:hypothetical protein
LEQIALFAKDLQSRLASGFFLLCLYACCRFKDAMFPEDGWEVQCPLTGELVTKSTCEVDHAPPSTFAQLVEGWLTAEGLSLEEVDIHPPPHPKCELRSVILTVSWQDYHAAHSDLRILSLEGHKQETAENHKGGA